MLINRVDNYKIKNTSNSGKMEICVSKKSFEILSAGIYKEKIPAIMRELISNGIDASNKAKTKEPIIVHFPSNTLEDFYVQDFGIGMSMETFVEVFVNYFSSNKENDGGQIGGFGLGAKTPFIYTDIFKVETTSPDDNIRRTFILSTQTEIPEYSHLEELDIQDSKLKGTKVSFKINKNKDVYEFINGFKQMFFSSYPIDLQFNNTNKNDLYEVIGNDLNLIKKITNELNENKYCFFYDCNTITSSCYIGDTKTNVNIRLGDVMYNYELENDRKIKEKIKIGLFFNNVKQYFNKDLDVDFFKSFIFLDEQLNGNITVNTSREYIDVTTSNTKKIKELLSKSTNDFMFSSIRNTIKFIENYKITGSSLLFFAFYKRMVNEYSVTLKKEYKDLSPILDELNVVLDKVFDPFLEIMNKSVSAFSLNSKLTNNNFGNMTLCDVLPKSSKGVFYKRISGTTLNSMIERCFTNYPLSYNDFFGRYGYDTACNLAKEYFDYMIIVSMNKEFNEYKPSLVNKFVKNTRIELFGNDYQKKINNIYFIYFEEQDLKFQNYVLDVEIDKIENELKNTIKTQRKKTVKVQKNNEGILAFNFINYTKQYDYNVIKSMLSNNAKHIVMPDYIVMKKDDNIFEKMFKKNFYIIDNKQPTNYNFNYFITKFKIIVTSNDIYNKLIEDGIIENTFLDQMLNKLNLNIGIFIDKVNNYINNGQSDTLAKILENSDKMKQCKRISNFFSKSTISLVSDKINEEIINSLIPNELCKMYIMTDGDCSTLENNNFDYNKKYDDVIKEFKKTIYYKNSSNYDDCIIEHCSDYILTINNFCKLTKIKRCLHKISTVKNIECIVNKSLSLELYCYNDDKLEQKMEQIVIKYFDFLNMGKFNFSHMLSNYLTSNYIRFLKKRMNKNNMIVNNYISQRVLELVNEI